jgi:hypothetical protein
MKRFFKFLGTFGDCIVAAGFFGFFMAFAVAVSPVKADENSFFTESELSRIQYQVYITGCYDSDVYNSLYYAAKTIYGTNTLVKVTEYGVFLPYVYNYDLYSDTIIIYFYGKKYSIFIRNAQDCVFLVSNRKD